MQEPQNLETQGRFTVIENPTAGQLVGLALLSLTDGISKGIHNVTSDRERLKTAGKYAAILLTIYILPALAHQVEWYWRIWNTAHGIPNPQ